LIKPRPLSTMALTAWPVVTNPHFRVLLGGSINDFSDAKFFKHSCDQTQVI
jgi:hypothetical protein